MRLWSTVVSQLEVRPRATTAESGGRSALAEPPLQVRDRGRHLRARPVLADRGHRPGAVADHVRERLRIVQERIGRDVRPDVALRGEAVAFRARADERLLSELELRVRATLHPRLVLVGRQHLDPREHRGVLQPAELGALTAEGAELRRPEARVVALPGNRIELAA